MQQLREAVTFGDERRYRLRDCDRVFLSRLDESSDKPALRVLRSPLCCPKVDEVCERLIGTLRRECLDRLIPLSESRLRGILRE